MSKKNLRKKILEERKKKYSKFNSINFKNIFEEIKKFKKTNILIGGYYPVNYEMDCLKILKELEIRRFKISLPVIKKNRKMNFHNWSFSAPLKLSKYGIPEPLTSKIVKPDIILIPLVAFDKKLFRIGYGGGYYDRYLSKIKKNKKILSIGLAFSFQEVKKIFPNIYDQKLDIILTEKKTLR